MIPSGRQGGRQGEDDSFDMMPLQRQRASDYAFARLRSGLRSVRGALPGEGTDRVEVVKPSEGDKGDLAAIGKGFAGNRVYTSVADQ